MELLTTKTLCRKSSNRANNRTVQLPELEEAIEKSSGIEANKTHSAEIPGDVKQTWANVAKAKKLLSYHPYFDLATGVITFVFLKRLKQRGSPSSITNAPRELYSRDKRLETGV